MIRSGKRRKDCSYRLSFYYVWLEVQPAKRNFETVLKLLGEAEVTEQGKASKLDVRMKF